MNIVCFTSGQRKKRRYTLSDTRSVFPTSLTYHRLRVRSPYLKGSEVEGDRKTLSLHPPSYSHLTVPFILNCTESPITQPYLFLTTSLSLECKHPLRLCIRELNIELMVNLVH